MRDLYIANLPEDVFQRLEIRSRQEGRNVQDVATDILVRDSEFEFEYSNPAARLAKSRALRASISFQETDSTELIRQDRDTRST